MEMFCNQCEQASKGTGCQSIGVCGKDPEVAALQDILLHQVKGISYLACRAGNERNLKDDVDGFVIDALFTTVTNVNFDSGRLQDWIHRAGEVRDGLMKFSPEESAPDSVRFEPARDLDSLLGQSVALGIQSLDMNLDADIRSLRQLLIYGLKGLAAYASHASLLGSRDDVIFEFIHEALAALADASLSLEKLVELNMHCGKVNIRCMEILDEAHTSRFGHPEPVQVSTGTKPGPAIIVSGHDLLDLEELLKQTEGKGINIYTHGEMLPAHGYPGLRKYSHLAGHFGTAWQNQQSEFDGIQAAVLFTTNCIQKPEDSYIDRTFTCGLVAWPGVSHIGNRDFGPVIEKALSLRGFEASEGGTLLTGCARNAILSVADKVIEAVKSGAIRHFFLVGGCDGARPGRNYYTELVESVPEDCVVLTLACGKFRFNNLDLGTIGGIPRLLDIGQCNDAYSAIKIAEALAGAFDCTVNDLPLSLILSWYEQKAVVILLSLLSLGIKGIRLGPTLPAFITPGILEFLVKNFEIRPTMSAEEDLDAILAVQA